MSKKLEKLANIILRNFKYQTPTPVVEEGKPVRYVVAVFAEDFRRMLDIANSEGTFVMSTADQERLAVEYAEQAKTVAGGYDLSKWSMGQLEAAYEDTAGIEQLKDFNAAISGEIKIRTRASTAAPAAPDGSSLH